VALPPTLLNESRKRRRKRRRRKRRRAGCIYTAVGFNLVK
jgi:hypothetical protein